jgi:hypothetical protein
MKCNSKLIFSILLFLQINLTHQEPVYETPVIIKRNSVIYLLNQAPPKYETRKYSTRCTQT